MKNLLLLATVSCITFGATSCKKDKNDPSISDKKCRISALTITPSSGDAFTYSFSYNNDNKVSQIITSGTPTYTTTFTYSGDVINKVSKTGTTTTGKTIMTINTSGNIKHTEERDLVSDTVTNTADYEYNAKGELLKITTKYGSSAPSISNCVFANGNLENISESGSLTNVEYYTDQRFRNGDYFQIIQLLNFGNTYYIINKNLAKSVKTGTNISNFDYTFDENDRITQLKFTTGADISIVDVQQVCD